MVPIAMQWAPLYSGGMGLRDYKQFGIGAYYHIFNRGSGKNNIFLDNGDFNFFLLRLKQNLLPQENSLRLKSLPVGSFSLISYCLMPNHFHFLIRQNTDIPTSQLLLKVCSSYSKYFNKKYERVGGLFQDQFKQVLVDDNEYLRWLSAYIHQNPKVAGLVNDLKQYPWSSYLDFIGLMSDGFCEKEIILNQFGSVKEYAGFVLDSYKIIKAKKEIESFLLD